MPSDVQGVASGTGVPPVVNGSGVPPVHKPEESVQPPGNAQAELPPACPGSPGAPNDSNETEESTHNWRKMRMKLVEDIRPLRSPDYWRMIRGQ